MKEITSKVSFTCVYNFILGNELTPLLVVSCPGRNVKVELGLVEVSTCTSSSQTKKISGFGLVLVFSRCRSGVNLKSLAQV